MNDMASDQYDQIGWFWKFLANILLTRVAQIFGAIFSHCKKLRSDKNCCRYTLGYFVDKLW